MSEFNHSYNSQPEVTFPLPIRTKPIGMDEAAFASLPDGKEKARYNFVFQSTFKYFYNAAEKQ